MIYQIENNFIDLRRLKYVTDIKEWTYNGKSGFYFKYFCGSHDFTTKIYKDKIEVAKLRMVLIDTWKMFYGEEE